VIQGSLRAWRMPRGRRSRSRLGEYAAQARGLGAAAPALVTREQGPALGSRLGALALLVGSLWLLLALLSDSRFRVHQVQVEGAGLVEQADVERALSDLSVRRAILSPSGGISIFGVRAHELEARLLQEYGCLDEAVVQCRLPNRVHVSLREREDLLVWHSGDRYWWVDRDGAVLGRASHPGDLVAVHDVTGWKPSPAGYVEGVPWRLARELVAASPDIRVLEYRPDQGLVVYVTERGWPVYLGHQGDGALKLALLRSLVAQLLDAGMDVDYIDLRNDRVPTVGRHSAGS